MRFMALPVSFRWDEAFVARIDEARGLVPRSAFVRQAVEQALGHSGMASDSGSATASRPDPAPAEQPEPYVFEAERQAVRAAVEAGATRARVEMGSALPAEGVRSSSQAKRDVAPVPKRGEKK